MAWNRYAALTAVGFAVGVGCFVLTLILFLVYLFRLRRVRLLEKNLKEQLNPEFRGMLWNKLISPIHTVAVPVQLEVFSPDVQSKPSMSRRSRRRAHTMQDPLTLDPADYDTVKPRRVLSESEMQPLDEVVPLRKVAAERPERRSLVSAMRRRSRMASFSYPVCSSLRVSGMIDFSLEYDSKIKQLQITIIQVCDIDFSAQNFVGLLGVSNPSSVDLEPNKDTVCVLREDDGSLVLKNQDKIGLSVAFALYPKGSSIKKTQVKYGSDSPYFCEVFKYPNIQLMHLHEYALRVQVLAHFSEKLGVFSIGEVSFPARKVAPDITIHRQEKLEQPMNDILYELSLRDDRYLGELGVSISYDALGNRLSVSIIGATNLPKAYGLPSCSVKIGVYFCRHRMAKEKSKIARKSDRPSFSSNHTFDIAKDKLAQVDVILEVRQHGPIQKSVIGYVHIGSEAEESGKEQWNELVSLSCVSKKQWHSIKRRRPLFY